jgi:hypothetical protein
MVCDFWMMIKGVNPVVAAQLSVTLIGAGLTIFVVTALMQRPVRHR